MKQEVIENLYKAFKQCSAPQQVLDVCLGCCVDEKVEKEMRQLPLRQLTRQHFYEYNSSAKSEIQPAQELKYFVPRLLELIEQGDEVHHSAEIYLDRLGRCDKDLFTAAQTQAIESYALALFQDYLPVAYRNSERKFQWGNAIEMLLMFDIGGIDIEPLLVCWQKNDTLESTVHYAIATYWDFWPAQSISNAFASDRTQFKQRMSAWLLNSQVRQLFAQRLLNTVVNHESEITAWPNYGRYSIKKILEMTFDYATELETK